MYRRRSRSRTWDICRVKRRFETDHRPGTREQERPDADPWTSQKDPVQRLHSDKEAFCTWQEKDEGGTGDSDDLLLDQFMVGLRRGLVKQELSRQLRRRDGTTFKAACTEARALEQELQAEEESLVTNPLLPTKTHSKAPGFLSTPAAEGQAVGTAILEPITPATETHEAANTGLGQKTVLDRKSP
uniref:Uncharacterized protein n=1 Tax=Knipowitschia caucasica TaxID=637954 RepID=A0AAV2JHP6_KNICA